jgi:hypothetical protein
VGDWTFAQKGIAVAAAVLLLWNLAGFIAEPSFHTGSGAPTENVLGVDFNGWHALSGLLLFGPAFVFALRPSWALFYAFYAAFALFVSGIWALAANQVLGVLTFPRNEADGVFHLAIGAVFLAIGLVQLQKDRASPGLVSP